MAESIGNTISELRQKSGATQEELGDAVGVSRQTIIAVEKGSYIPSLLLAFKLAKFFKKSVEQVFWIE